MYSIIVYRYIWLSSEEAGSCDSFMQILFEILAPSLCLFTIAVCVCIYKAQNAPTRFMRAQAACT